MNGAEPKRVLLVEDHRDCREVIAVLLGVKHSVSSCASAEEALTALEIIKPDLLLLDIGMTPIDGVQCLRMIRAIPGYSSTPAIALTGYARDVEKQAFLRAGFQAVIPKPILDHQELETVIDTLLNPRGASQRRPVAS